MKELCILILIYVASLSAVSIKCGKNEVYVIDKDIRIQTCQPSCANPDIECVTSQDGWEGCRCIPGTIRNFSGDCIPRESCKFGLCGENEIYKECAHCEKTCLVRDGSCSTAICNEGCYCRDHYVRNNRNICVLESDCDDRLRLINTWQRSLNKHF